MLYGITGMKIEDVVEEFTKAFPWLKPTGKISVNDDDVVVADITNKTPEHYGEFIATSDWGC